MNTPAMRTSTPHSASVISPGRMRESIQTARPSIRKPNAFLTATIHGPALGNSFPADAPTSSSGAPMPMLMANRAEPPRSMSPVWPMTVSAATSGGATQAVTMSDDSAPMTKAPMTVPLFCWPLTDARRLWMPEGICRSNRPNILSASTTNRPANTVSTHGALKIACSCTPIAAAATPAAV